MAPALRSCLRCIAKKRKCDHAFPCSLCVKAEANCDYPPDQQRRGPIAGYTKILEQRMQDLEAALAYVVGIDGVQQILKTAPYNGPAEIAPNETWASLSREDRIELILSRPLRTVQDLLAYTEALPRVAPNSPRPRNRPASEGRHEEALSSRQQRPREMVEARGEVAGQPALAGHTGDSSRRTPGRPTHLSDDPEGNAGLRQSNYTGLAGPDRDCYGSGGFLDMSPAAERAEPGRVGQTSSEHQDILPTIHDDTFSATVEERPAWFMRDRPVGPESVATTIPSVGTPFLPQPSASDLFW